jgi:hypothetical protein
MILRLLGAAIVLVSVAAAQGDAASRPKVGAESRAERRGLTAERQQRRGQQGSALQQTERAVTAGLDWLKRHQSIDGKWECHGFSSNCDKKRGAACEGQGVAAFDVGVTGLALLAFLGAGYDEQRASPYRESVSSGLRYLAGVQDPQGCFGPTSDPRHVYSHAIATAVMCEALASTADAAWLKASEGGVAYIYACQNPYKGWRYGKQPGDNDTSVTGWMLMALKAAKDAGFPINPLYMRDGLAFIDAVTDEDTGRTGYFRKGEHPVRPEGSVAKWPGTETESLTAFAICSRFACGEGNNPLNKTGAKLLAKRLPSWDEMKGSIDYYYWYYGTLATFRLGGADWEKWQKALKPLVLDHQVKAGCAAGSWDPKDPWGDAAGRVYSTALMTMCLEVYYRYPRDPK